MKQLLIIPDRSRLCDSLALAERYGTGFEFNDLFYPDVLDDERTMEEICSTYAAAELPSFRTLHGAFFDVIPFSPDRRIREISELRIDQSIEAARRIGAGAVVFHTNYNPFLNSDAYVESFIEKNTSFWSEILRNNTDICIYLENMFDTSPDIMAALAEKLCCHTNFGICYDHAHAVISGTPPLIWAKKLGRYVKHIHINDNDLRADLHLAWGSGSIDRKQFYDIYAEHMDGASVLVETTSVEAQRSSLEMLSADGVI
ncbi:MAG: TIM barrel protein [Oscillospiraceae bacterium]|nr:TIM barrel protein [Oscillospiraceae bacterium]